MKTSEKTQQPDEGTNGQNTDTSPADQHDWTWADPKSLKVKPEFQRLIPLQSKGELLALEKSIEAEGCREPLTVWQGRSIVLDGHTRRELAIKHKKRVKVREIELPDEKAATEYILEIQRQRRNLTREALSYFRGAEYNATKESHGGSRRGRKSKGQSDLLKSTASQLAEKYGVSEKTIKRDAVFAQVVHQIVNDYGDAEIQRKLLSADVKLTHGAAKVLLKMTPGERKSAVDELIEQGELPRSKKKGTASTPRPKAIAQTLVTRLQAKGDAHARSVLQQMAKLLGMEVTEKAPDK